MENNQTNGTEGFTEQEIKEGKGYAICAYLGILVLVPILGAKQNRFAMYHANQGLILLIFMIICNVIGSWVPFAGLVGSAGWLIGVIFLILGIVNVVNGVARQLPVIGQFNLLKY